MKPYSLSCRRASLSRLSSMNKELKSWFLSKTVWLNVITFLVTALSFIPQSFDLSESSLKVILFAVSILNLALRMAGGQPIAFAAKK